MVLFELGDYTTSIDEVLKECDNWYYLNIIGVICWLSVFLRNAIIGIIWTGAPTYYNKWGFLRNAIIGIIWTREFAMYDNIVFLRNAIIGIIWTLQSRPEALNGS